MNRSFLEALVLLLLVFAFVGALYFYSSGQKVVHIPGDAVLVVTYGDMNLGPFYDFLHEHNIPYYVYDVNHPLYYLVYGDRNIPLMPPVIYLPSAVCYKDGNLVASAGSPSTLISFVSRCKGLQEVNG